LERHGDIRPVHRRSDARPQFLHLGIIDALHQLSRGSRIGGSMAFRHGGAESDPEIRQRSPTTFSRTGTQVITGQKVAHAARAASPWLTGEPVAVSRGVVALVDR